MLKEAQNGFNRDTPKERQLYLLQNYEVHVAGFHHSWCITTQIRGGLNSLLSSKWKLPNHIYICFSNDQVEDLEILDNEIFKVLENLFTYLNRAVIERRAVLPRKAKRGQLTSFTVVKTVAKATNTLNAGKFKFKR